ncbi:MAG TPA: hypothetical protein VKU38_07955 [Ktedonobacteraceae bacterium]|nr:hypothetical protein [Ktedonobacteraceae bacterium]
MNTKNQGTENNGGGWSRWLRVGILTLSMAGPVINTFLNQMRNRSQRLREQAMGLPDTARAIQATSAQRLDELSLSSRKRAAEQTQLLRKQARQLQVQAQQLQKALREEAKQRQKLQKLQKQLRKSRQALSRDLLKRGEVLTSDLIEQGGKLSHDLLERGSKVTHDLTERGSQATQELVKRGSKTSQALLERGGEVSQDLLQRGGKVSQDLLERGGKTSQALLERGGEVTQGLVRRGSKLSQNVAERSGQLLEPARKRNSRFWTVFGFTTGLLAAGIVTYVLVRRRVASINSDIDEQIELPHNGRWNSSSVSRPAGEIHHVGSEGTPVATLTDTRVESATPETTTEKLQAVQSAQASQEVQAPADAAFVGVVSTKLYYPAEVTPEAKDIIYFASEEEAKADGFIPAPIE